MPGGVVSDLGDSTGKVQTLRVAANQFVRRVARSAERAAILAIGGVQTDAASSSETEAANPVSSRVRGSHARNLAGVQVYDRSCRLRRTGRVAGARGVRRCGIHIHRIESGAAGRTGTPRRRDAAAGWYRCPRTEAAAGLTR